MKRIVRYVPYIFISLFVLITHGLLLLNDGIYWDDWLWVTALKNKNWPMVHAAGFGRGQPLDSYFMWFFSGFQNIEFAHRFVAFLSILISALLIYAVCRQVGVLTNGESLWIALLSMAFPAFQTQIVLSTTNYLFYFMLFLGGVLLALKSTKGDSFRRYGLRFGALILFFLSFSLASLLVFYFGFLLLLVLTMRKLKSLSLKEIVTRFLPRHLDYILLPFLYWMLKVVLFPVSGMYSNYNQFNFSPGSMLLNLASFLYNGIYMQIDAALRNLLNQPALGMLGILVVLFGATYFRSASFNKMAKPYGLLAYGVLLVGLGIFPYVAVGLSPTLAGWGTRHALLLALPVALVIVVIARFIFSDPKAGFSRLGWVFLTMLLLAFGLATMSHYIEWQARWVKDSSVMANLGQLDGAEKFSVYWVNDQYPLGGEDNYRFYEWSSMFGQVWGDEKRFGLDQRYTSPNWLAEFKPYFTKNYNLSGLDPASCQATVTIRPMGNPRSDFRLATGYFYYKFIHPQDLQDFLARVTQVQVQPFPSLLAVNCRQK